MEGFDQHLQALRAERERLERASGLPPFVPRAGDEEGMRFMAPQPTVTLPYFSNESDLLHSITQLKDEHAANVRRITELSLSASGGEQEFLSRDFLTSSALFATAPAGADVMASSAQAMAGLGSDFLGGFADPAVAAALAGARLASDTRSLTHDFGTAAAAPSGGWTSQYRTGGSAVGPSTAAASSRATRPNFDRPLAAAASAPAAAQEPDAPSGAPQAPVATAVPTVVSTSLAVYAASPSHTRNRGSLARAPARPRAGEPTPTAQDFDGMGPVVSHRVPRYLSSSRPSSARERPRPASAGRLERPPASARSSTSVQVERDLRASADAAVGTRSGSGFGYIAINIYVCIFMYMQIVR